jgi:hypothetical protein
VNAEVPQMSNPYVKLRELPEKTQPSKLIPLKVNGPAQSYCSAPNGERVINQSYDAASALACGPHLRRATARLSNYRNDSEVEPRKEAKGFPLTKADIKPDAPAWESFLVSKGGDWSEKNGRISPNEYIKLVGASPASA